MTIFAREREEREGKGRGRGELANGGGTQKIGGGGGNSVCWGELGLLRGTQKRGTRKKSGAQTTLAKYYFTLCIQSIPSKGLWLIAYAAAVTVPSFPHFIVFSLNSMSLFLK